MKTTELEPNTLFLKGYELRQVRAGVWRMEPSGRMRVGVHLVGSPGLFKALGEDKSFEQARNVATLPGVLDPVVTLPDIHQGYGFPIGGVAAFRRQDGVVSPGGVGYDINCGVRLLKTPFHQEAIAGQKTLRSLVTELFERVPCGVGSKRKDLVLSSSDLEEVLIEGARWAVRRGFGTGRDLAFIEEQGVIQGANPDKLSPRAKERGESQLGTLGSGNHFLEIQVVDQILDQKAADIFGLFEGQVVVAIHTGSRGLGYQVCADYLEENLSALKRYGIKLVDRELAAAPLNSPEGQSYMMAMAGAANFAFANRQVISHWVRQVFKKHLGGQPLELLYDVCHNIAKMEWFSHKGREIEVCVHRKGATRAYPPEHPAIPTEYRSVGQPALVPGDMGRASFVLVGKQGAMEQTWGSACHGAGRELSRARAKRLGKASKILRDLEEKGICVRAAGRRTLVEEMPQAYKDVSKVVGVMEEAQIAGIVVRLRPVGVVKG